MDYDPLRRGFAEFVGTFALVFVGAGSILTIGKVFLPAINGPQTQDIYGGLTLVGVALAHGLAIAVMVSAVGHISRGHFNPAITLGFLMGGPRPGAAMNPARAFGRELLSRTWSNAWVWYVGPFVGGALAALAYDFLYLRPPRPLPVGPPETGVLEPRPGDTAVS